MGVLITTVVFLGTFTALYCISQWFDHHQMIFQSPIIVRTPIVIQERKIAIINPVSRVGNRVVAQAHAQEPSPTPEWEQLPDNVDKKKWEYITQQKDAHLVLHIWQKESDYGRNTVRGALDQYCRTKGKYNEFGLGGMRYMNCYDTFEDNVQAVIRALDSYGLMSDKMKLCYYNLGIKEESCNYLLGWN